MSNGIFFHPILEANARNDLYPTHPRAAVRVLSANRHPPTALRSPVSGFRFPPSALRFLLPLRVPAPSREYHPARNRASFNSPLATMCSTLAASVW